MAPRRFHRRQPTVRTANGLAMRNAEPMFGLVPEVVDHDVQREPAPVDVGDDGRPGPMPVGVDEIPKAAVAQ